MILIMLRLDFLQPTTAQQERRQEENLIQSRRQDGQGVPCIILAATLGAQLSSTLQQDF